MQGGDRLEIKQGTYSERFTPPSGSPSAHTIIASFGTDIVTFPFNYGPYLYETQSSYIDFIGGCTSGINRTCRMVFDGTGSGENFSLFSISDLNGLGSHHITFDGVRWTKGGDGAVTGGGMGVETTAAKNLTFRNCRMDNNGLVSNPNTAIRGPGYGYYMSGGYNTTVENCEIDHNGGWGLHQYTAYNEPPSNGNIIRNNIIHDNAQTPSSQQGTGGMIIGATCQNQLVYNNILYNNNQQPGISPGMGIAISYGCTGAAIYSNTVYGHASGIYTGQASGTLIKNNIVYGNGQAFSDNGIGTSMSNNLTIDPKFVSLSNYNFYLQSTSPAIDAGITLTQVATDINGTPRPLGAAYDIGAYECY
jgi:parallel beta-helix repeat protein